MVGFHITWGVVVVDFFCFYFPFVFSSKLPSSFSLSFAKFQDSCLQLCSWTYQDCCLIAYWFPSTSSFEAEEEKRGFKRYVLDYHLCKDHFQISLPALTSLTIFSMSNCLLLGCLTGPLHLMWPKLSSSFLETCSFSYMCWGYFYPSQLSSEPFTDF